jgi:hypothetical protein
MTNFSNKWDLLKYLESQTKFVKPFDCAKLLIVPEDTTYKESYQFKQGELICGQRLLHEEASRFDTTYCHLHSFHCSDPQNLEFLCGLNNTPLKLKTVSIEEDKKNS